MTRGVREPDRQLSPWDQAPYFQPVKETWYNSVGAGIQIADANTARVAIIFSAQGAGTVCVSTKPSVNVNNGIAVQTSAFPVAFLDSETGPLCKQAWFACLNGASPTLTVIEILLSKWPGEQ